MSYSARVIENHLKIDYEGLSKNISSDFIVEHGWIYELDSYRNITNIQWNTGANFYIDRSLLFFKKLLPYIKAGSYIYFNGEDGNNYGFFFEDGTVTAEALYLVREKDYELLQKIQRQRTDH
ncbi:hypothetical protein [Eubacterium sp. An3]|uniref:hypothetical protein n=1 Tax=Eubacterium sp. An3 TaxID=1965628 RepID=UPI000B37FA6B|nr:hypothetical protein [Eubacterium sp. An3]OUO25922.1 hypothetical protein B5F87_16045 [Eubacterium sp. An3]